MHQRYFYSLRGIIIITAMEGTKWERIRKHLKNHEKDIQGMMKTISFSILFSTLQLFLIVHFSLFYNN